MLDLLVTNGRVVTPHGAGAWDVAVQGERIVAVTPPGTFTEAARTIDAAGFVNVTSANAAKILGLYPRKGALAPGSDADIVLIDPAVVRPLARADFHVSDYSPWEGWPVKGWPVTTILRGKVIVERGTLHGSLHDGRLVTRKIDPVMLRRPAC